MTERSPADGARRVTLTVTETARGFGIASFTDLYGAECSIRESSLAEIDALWLGVDEVEGKPARMHIGTEHAAALVPLLQRFVDTGYLREMGQETPPLPTRGTEVTRIAAAWQQVRDWIENDALPNRQALDEMDAAILALVPRAPEQEGSHD